MRSRLFNGPRVRNRDHGERAPKLHLVGALVLALTLALTSANLAGAQAQVSITYNVGVSSESIHLCTGESRNISVLIDRRVQRGGTTFGPFSVWGGRVLGFINDEAIGHFEPTDGGREVVGPPAERALFKFVADAPGTTTIDFVISETGEESSLGGGWPQQDDVVDVEVTDCYQAHTSGLGSIFVENDMHGLNEWFLLTAFTPNTNGVETETQIMFFSPNPQNRLVGGHALVDTATTLLGGQQGTCTLYFSGRYEVVFYIPPNQPAPPGADIGDLMLYGRGTVFCQGRQVLKLDYGSNPGFQISFKPKPVP
jgi:hypothetical protein